MAVTGVDTNGALIAHRPTDAGPSVVASMEALPFEESAFDSALVVLSLHHCADLVAASRELRRVARRRVVVVTFDPVVRSNFWFVRDYLQAIPSSYPTVSYLEDLLGARAKVEPLAVPADCSDGFLAAYWARPTQILERERQEAMFALRCLPGMVRHRALNALAEDLVSGRWHAEHGRLLHTSCLDVGLRVLTFYLS